MPTFAQMKTVFPPKTIGQQLREESEYAMNETFSNTTRYRKGKLYDCDLKELEEIEFKFHKVKTYTIATGDQVEYHVQFRPGISIEHKYSKDFDEYLDKRYRIGFYLDVYDENTKQIDKWLIVAKDSAEFDRYVALKCNWTFEWIDHMGQYHSCLGCNRDRASYSSGIWSDGQFTSIENQTMFIVPTNDDTLTLDYNIRLVICDNYLYPKVYEVTKLTDITNFGCIRVTLKQDHFNEHKDLCGKDVEHKYFTDEKIHMVADFYNLSFVPDKSKDWEKEIYGENTECENYPFEEYSEIWSLSESADYLYIKGQSQKLYATCGTAKAPAKWYIYIDGQEQTQDTLDGYFDIEIDETNNTFTITAINKVMANYVVKIGVGSKNKNIYDNFVEMEVRV